MMSHDLMHAESDTIAIPQAIQLRPLFYDVTLHVRSSGSVANMYLVFCLTIIFADSDEISMSPLVCHNYLELVSVVGTT